MIARVDLAPIGSGDRCGVAVRIEDSDGFAGWGEASPLVGTSPDRADDCARALGRVLDSAGARSIADVVAAIDPRLPAARFAAETALCDLAAARRGVPLCRVLAAAPADRVDATALVTGDDDALERALAAGIRCVKVKLGRADRARERAIVAAIRERLPPGSRLRIDVNGRWSVAEARAELAALAPLGIEFAEQPVSPAELAALGPVPVAIAADESLRAGPPPRGVAVYVLKPAVLGGLTRCLELAAIARAAGIDPIVSHLRDGPIALAACAELALAIGGARPHGLHLHADLASYRPLAPPPQFERGAIVRQARPGHGVTA